MWSRWNSNPGAGPKDEYHWCQVLGKADCSRRLQAHWGSWYSEKDFHDMKSVGLNTVRIPIGYWAFKPFPNDPYVQGQEAWLDRAIQWARNAGLAVWIDLHGAPGSQNGFDNSGLRDTIGWQTSGNLLRTIEVIQYIARKYTSAQFAGTVAVIELLNEPLGPRLNTAALRQFHWDGLGSVRAVGGTWVAMSDGFFPPSSWNNDFNGDSRHLVNGKYANVIMDHHHYQVFSPGEVSRDFNTQIRVACGSLGEVTNSNKYVVVGEWSAAMTDCARWLNGFGRGARYEGVYDGSPRYGACSSQGTLSRMSYDQRQRLRMFIEAQIITYERRPYSRGWIFWTWKTEPGHNNDDWNMSALLSKSVFPKPVTAIRYPRICG
ncbi:hypothetical protein ABW21_db0202278 [Orbilia brochopaga]|nr:hypothetical protein ABW21_db0202278 [Drechslerella brochopaga]